ncbi:cbb3-type cytochrome c oxidase subunit I, partial [Mariprofundus ferrooxydans]|nr:cbb3-type cytochrome c oxidase subunit I [Mariprofundus ferrooxydans]
VNALSHYTDWTIGHVHSGALGWVAMVSVGAIYHLVPRLWKTDIHSVSLVNTHFWIHTIGTVIYICAMWVSGIMQGLMWRATDDYGNLVYSFAETVVAMHPYYVLRSVGGLLVLVGALIMLYNVVMTIKKADTQPVTAAAKA